MRRFSLLFCSLLVASAMVSPTIADAAHGTGGAPVIDVLWVEKRGRRFRLVIPYRERERARAVVEALGGYPAGRHRSLFYLRALCPVLNPIAWLHAAIVTRRIRYSALATVYVVPIVIGAMIQSAHPKNSSAGGVGMRSRGWSAWFRWRSHENELPRRRGFAKGRSDAASTPVRARQDKDGSTGTTTSRTPSRTTSQRVSG